ncbi:MAG: hypothetical protein KC544_00125 [Gemmatimonadetes bacterium]|nr:hypothetical protein [Gemmatimonadota bacterium]MCB9517528.1 hypothetical protein [Gemmatimonadales bacterium]MCA9761515.1 hypothetical protein [Gemmatimonadota bacterium]MCA9769562.1 hypothetical protein [Gemmatimonadota bacterium]HPF60843.1 hypothetical protein [Gemmatimonadales bacterium]
MTRFAWRCMVFAGLVLGAAPALVAQVPRDGRPVRDRLEEVFLRRVRVDLALDDAQFARMATVLESTASARRRLEASEREVKQELAAQLRPGVAADERVVTSAIDRLMANRVAYAESFATEVAGLREFLTPVQVGQYVMMREQLMQRARDMIEARPGVPVRNRP